jgi:hypothetical protein
MVDESGAEVCRGGGAECRDGAGAEEEVREVMQMRWC